MKEVKRLYGLLCCFIVSLYYLVTFIVFILNYVPLLSILQSEYMYIFFIINAMLVFFALFQFFKKISQNLLEKLAILLLSLTIISSVISFLPYSQYLIAINILLYFTSIIISLLLFISILFSKNATMEILTLKFSAIFFLVCITLSTLAHPLLGLFNSYYYQLFDYLFFVPYFLLTLSFSKMSSIN